MTQFFAHLVFDTDDGSIGLAKSIGAESAATTPPSSQKGMPFSELDLQELDAMNAHHEL